MSGSFLRPVTEADAPALLAIYAPYVRNTAITFEYEVPTEAEFARRIRTTLTRFPYLAAVRDGEILGYAYTGPFAARPAYQWAAETSIYIRQDAHRLGLGKRALRSHRGHLQGPGADEPLCEDHLPHRAGPLCDPRQR